MRSVEPLPRQNASIDGLPLFAATLNAILSWSERQAS